MKTFRCLSLVALTLLVGLSNISAGTEDEEIISLSPSETPVETVEGENLGAPEPVIPAEKQPEYQSLFFDPVLNNVQMPKQSVDYEMREKDGIRIGPIELRGEDVAIALTQDEAEMWELNFGLQYTTRWKKIYFLSFRWPMEYLTTGRMEILDDRSKVLWGRQITDSDLSSWEKFLKQEDLTSNPQNSPKGEAETRSMVKNASRVSRAHRGSQFGLIGREILSIPIWNIKTPFRFCVTQDGEMGRLAACSRRYKFVRDMGRYRLETVSREVRPRVLVNNKPMALKGTAIFLDNKSPIKFASLLSSGTYFEFVASPRSVNVVDLVRSDDGHFIEAIGYGLLPEGPVEKIDRRNEDFWNFLNFMPSIGDRREFWRARFPNENPYLYFRGNGGIPFRQSFLFDDLPSETIRPKISRKTKRSTYKDTTLIKGRIDASVKAVKSEQVAAHKSGSQEFEWKYDASKSGEVNQSLLMVDDGNNTWKAYHEMYRGYPRELGLRLTGVISNELEFVFLGEVAGQWWFESLFGWENRYLAYQRWGVAAKYFQSFASVGGKKEEGKDNKLIKFQVTTFDLKYRLTPGVWNQDPTIGLMLNTQSMVFENFSVDMAGAGIFWARSMPEFLDRIVNWIPWFNYPKWVDAEFIYYPMSLKENIDIGQNFAVNFHGKILWGKQFFGEAGFGVKGYSFADLTPGQRKKVALGAAYGTLGIGYSF